jgi:putative transposase
VRLLCNVLDVPKNVYYDWIASPFGKRHKKTENLDQMIIKIFNEHDSRYGSLRI